MHADRTAVERGPRVTDGWLRSCIDVRGRVNYASTLSFPSTQLPGRILSFGAHFRPRKWTIRL
jgi:hypothetical protein